MKCDFSKTEKRNKISSIWFSIFIFLLIIPQGIISADDEQWKSLPEANYSDVLELVATRSLANYQEISSWQGRINSMETIHHYGANAAELVRVDKSVLREESQHICSIDKTIAEFVVDMRNDKLYSIVEPNVRFKAVDLNQDVSLAKGVKISSTIKTILTPDIWMSYEPDHKYIPKFHQGQSEKMAFINIPTEVKGGLNGEIRDPRIFFNSGGENKKLWDTLLRLKENINDRVKERVAGYPHIEISSLNTQNGIKYRILATWEGGPNYIMKYVRLLIEVDESIGFNATKVEVTSPNGIKLTSKQYTYEKIGEIYIPKTIKEVFLDSEGEPSITSEIAIETAGLNKTLPDETFTIKNLGVEEDTLVTDKIKNAEFRYSKGALVPIGEPNNLPD